MLDFLKPFKKEPFDFLTFLEGEEEGQISIVGTEYVNPGEPLDIGSMGGNSYHIVLFRDHESDEERYGDVDSFDAVLLDPLEYISNLITTGWYGIIARKTTTSGPIIQRMLDKFEPSV